MPSVLGHVRAVTWSGLCLPPPLPQWLTLNCQHVPGAPGVGAGEGGGAAGVHTGGSTVPHGPLPSLGEVLSLRAEAAVHPCCPLFSLTRRHIPTCTCWSVCSIGSPRRRSGSVLAPGPGAAAVRAPCSHTPPLPLPTARSFLVNIPRPGCSAQPAGPGLACPAGSPSLARWKPGTVSEAADHGGRGWWAWLEPRGGCGAADRVPRLLG